MARLREPEKQPGVPSLEADMAAVLGGSITVTALLSLQSGPTLSSAHTRLGQIRTTSGLVTTDEMATRAQRKQVALPGHKPRSATSSPQGFHHATKCQTPRKQQGPWLLLCLTELAG